MLIPIEEYRGVESGGNVVLIGNGPSMINYIGKQFACPIIGINRSANFWPEQDYFVTVAHERIMDVAFGTIKANKAVFTCKQKTETLQPLLDKIDQKIVCADMSLPDLYADFALKGDPHFDCDLTKPTYSTFGGVFAIQVAWFLGYKTCFLVGYDGGTEKFYGNHPRQDEWTGAGYKITGELHHAIFSNIVEFIKDNPGHEIFNCNKDSEIGWFPHYDAPLKEN